MGGGASKKGGGDLKPEEEPSRERRPSHIETNPPPKSDVLVECNTCGRRFAADRIGRHAEVCAKTSNNRRGVFDVQDQRLQGTEAEDLKEDIANMEITYSAHDWKENHERMLADMREAKKHNRPNSALDNVEILTNKGGGRGGDYDDRRRHSRDRSDSRDRERRRDHSRDRDRDRRRR